MSMYNGIRKLGLQFPRSEMLEPANVVTGSNFRVDNYKNNR